MRQNTGLGVEINKRKQDKEIEVKNVNSLLFQRSIDIFFRLGRSDVVKKRHVCKALIVICWGLSLYPSLLR